MTTLLAYEGLPISLGSTIDQMRDQIALAFTSRGWQIVGKTQGYQSLIPGTATNPANAFDNMDSLSAYSNTLPLQVGVQLTSAQIITSYTINSSYSPTYPERSPKSWTLEWSDNGVSGWTVADTQTNIAWAGMRGERKTFNVGGSPGAHAYWRINISANSAPAITPTTELFELRLYVGSSGEFISAKSGIYIIPPVTENIGDSNSREICYMSFTGTSLSIQPVVQNLVGMPQTVAFYEKTGGSVAAGLSIPTGATYPITASISNTVMTVTSVSGTPLQVGTPITGLGIIPGNYIASLGTGVGGSGTYNLGITNATIASQTCYGGTVVNVSGSVGSGSATPQDNLRSLYVALKNSVDSTVSGWDWLYTKPSPQNANDTHDWIIGICKTAVPNIVVCNNTNINPSGSVGYNPSVIGNYFPVGILGVDQCPGYSTPVDATITVDLVSGWIYYLQLTNRGFALASKTNANYFGPIHCEWADHAKAVAALPTCQHRRGISPIELVVGFDDPSSSHRSYAIPAKFLGLSSSQNTSPHYCSDYNSVCGSNPISGFRVRDQFGDLSNTRYNSAPWYHHSITLVMSGIFYYSANEAVQDDFQIHRMVMNGNNETSDALYYPNIIQDAAIIVPQLAIQDWFKFRGSASNEALACVGDTTPATTLNQVMDNTTSYGTLSVVSTANLVPTGGYVVVENELIQYTGISGGNTLTGVTRARYGSTMQNHWPGDQVFQGMWFTIINGGALFAGYVKPT